MFLHFLVPDFVNPVDQFLCFSGRIRLITKPSLPSTLINFEILTVKREDNGFSHHYRNQEAFLILDHQPGSLITETIVGLFDEVNPMLHYRGYLDLTKSGLTKMETYRLTNSTALKQQLREMFFELVEVGDNEASI